MKELMNDLNQLLADLNLLYRKLQNYHWNVQGKEFFVLHGKLEEYYNGVNEEIDQIAEQILMLEGQPLGRMKDYLEIGKIEEASNEKVGAAVILENVLADFSYVKRLLISVKEKADENKVYEVSSMADSMIAQYSKAVWMLEQSK
ncbi:Dps family protein [Clostridium transplantifaecale]|uniref:Dps family protein n=1 Tax=Clostridium transplantifaecale TaxID=2479838 RepID=UPI000F6385AB|nr:DNA starvation/stationary phase protection protein [Clostridium transplantifaecale]